MGQAGVGLDRNVALAPCILLCPQRRRANWVENVTHHVLAVHPGAWGWISEIGCYDGLGPATTSRLLKAQMIGQRLERASMMAMGGDNGSMVGDDRVGIWRWRQHHRWTMRQRGEGRWRWEMRLCVDDWWVAWWHSKEQRGGPEKQPSAVSLLALHAYRELRRLRG